MRRMMFRQIIGRLAGASAVFLLPFSALSQDFAPVNAGFSPFAYGWSSMADYDNDGDLDVVLSGIQSNGQGKATVFQNNDGTFSPTSVVLEGLQKGVAQWVDFDLDGDYDLLLSGIADDYSRKTILYFNDNGLIKPTTYHFPGFANGQAGWFDYDRDGDPDLLISGDTLSLNHFTGLYRNDGANGFTLVPTSMPNLVSSAMAFADIDNDGDIDVAISGDSGGGDITRIYKNVEGTFVQVNADFEGVSAGSMAFGDIDNDGDMDLFYQGVDFITGTSVFWIYRNDGNDNWVKVYVGLPGLYLGGLALADFDLDGWVDFIATGKGTGCGASATVMYRNNCNGNFWEVPYDFPPLTNSSVSAGDYDNDGDADIILTGVNAYGEQSTYLYRNLAGSNTFSQSLTPGMPEGLHAEVSGTSITFKWNRPATMRYTMNDLTYNLRVGTTPGGNEIFSSNTLPATGQMIVPAMGNVQFDTIWTINQLREGTYFWSVQAVSPGFSISEPAPEQTVDLYTGIAEEDNGSGLLWFNQPDALLTVASGNEGIIDCLSVFDANGRRVARYDQVGSGQTVSLKRLPKGFYIVVAAVEGKNISKKIVL